MMSVRDLYGVTRKGSIYLLAGRIVMPIIGVAVTIYVVRSLSLKQYGIYSVLLAVLGYLSLLSALGLPSIFQRFLPEFVEKGRLGQLKKLVRDGLALRLALILALSVAVILLSRVIGGLVRVEDFGDYFKLFAIAVVFFCEAQLLGVALSSLFMYKEFVLSQLLYTLGRAGLIFLLLGLGGGLTGLLAAEAAAYAVWFAIQALYYRGYSKRHPPLEGEEPFPTRRVARFGGYSYFNEMGSRILNVQTDFFVIAAFLGPQAVGLYAFATKTMTSLTALLPQHLLMEVIRPAFFTKYVRSEDDRDLVRMFNLVTKLTAFILFPLVAGVFVLGDKLIVHVFDVKYLDSLTVLWIAAFFSALNAFEFPLGLVTQSLEKVEINFYSKIFAVYNLLLDLIVVRSYGIVGVALATCSAVLLKNLFIYVLTRRHIDLSIDWASLTRIATNAAAMTLLVYPLRGYVTSLPSFLAVVAAGALAYFVVAYLNKGFSPSERVVLNRILPRPVFVF
ncbi:MAG: hypothetical protein C4521_13070 [Actinobacteria bacterium]|nr:MAG: hypothetical protein C4521_13070 [Actinomycetota bacterium]